MAARREHEFVYIITSDGCMDVYPDNKTSDFRIMLKDPLEMDGDWEVGLLEINYPYTWTNVGQAAKATMRYCIDGREAQNLFFPDWQCQSLRDVIKFMQRRLIGIGKEEKKESLLTVNQDDFGRFRFLSSTPKFDVGFSPNLLKLLGLAGHERVNSMSLEAFEERQRCRDLLSGIWKDDVSMEITDQLVHFLKVTNNVVDIAQQFAKFVDTAKLVASTELGDIPQQSPIYDDVLLEKQYILPTLGIFDSSPEIMKNVAGLIHHLKKLYLFDGGYPPRKIRAVTPGMLNPVQRMYVYTNIIEPVDMNDGSKKLLKLVNT